MLFSRGSFDIGVFFNLIFRNYIGNCYEGALVID